MLIIKQKPQNILVTYIGSVIRRTQQYIMTCLVLSVFEVSNQSLTVFNNEVRIHKAI